MIMWHVYKNGNYTVKINTKDGTKIRETEEDDFIPDFAENMDIKITNKCNLNCPFCHEGSYQAGKHADIMHEKFIDTLHPYQEVALGGGNVLVHPNLIPFLQKLKDMNVIANITVNQVHFEKNQELIKYLVDEKLIYGLGVSLVKPTDEFVNMIKKYPNAVIHVINGIVSPLDLAMLSEEGLKILILGYKELRRGECYYQNDSNMVKRYQRSLKKFLPKILEWFNTVSFDNLAIEQLRVKRLLSKKQWESFYMGDDGTSTYYIDMVERKFARSSIASLDKRYDLLDNVDDMFKIIRNEGD